LDFGLSQYLLPCVSNFLELGEREREREKEEKGFRVLLWPSGPSLYSPRIGN
jgi:hypothetical protein